MSGVSSKSLIQSRAGEGGLRTHDNEMRRTRSKKLRNPAPSAQTPIPRFHWPKIGVLKRSDETCILPSVGVLPILEGETHDSRKIRLGNAFIHHARDLGAVQQIRYGEAGRGSI